MQLFYSPDISNNVKQFTFSKEESKHINKVLRKKNGDTLLITNGKGTIFKAVLCSTDPKNCLVDILSEVHETKHPYRLHIAIAPTKMNDRLEWFLEKATEIGIDEITPIICDHSERKVVKTARLIKILQSAMKQSLQAHLPLLNEPLTFKQFLAIEYSASKYIAHCEPSKKSVFFNSIQDQKDILMLIGPEGDFSSAEIAAAIDHNFTPVSLGNTRLRTETAGIVACHTVALAN